MTTIKTLALALVLTLLGLAPTTLAGVMASSNHYVDAFINVGTGPYDEASNLTAGGARPWYESTGVQNLYGGSLNAAQRESFRFDVLTRVVDTFQRSGLNLAITDNPRDTVPHALSVVSGTYSPNNPDAVGIASVGGSGFSFIDSLVQYAKSPDELKWAVAHSVAHELMHTFGASHHDETGNFLDSAVVSWQTLTNPDATFSPDAVADLRSRDWRSPFAGYTFNGYGGSFASAYGNNYGAYGWGAMQVHGPSCTDCNGTLLAAPVPEPTTIALWSAAALGLIVARRRLA